MICNDTSGGAVEIRYDSYPHKYGSAMAEYIDLCCDLDNWTGDPDGPVDHCSIYGKRLLWSDSQGFVFCDKYPSTQAARQVFDAADEYWAAWSDEHADDEAMAGICVMYSAWLTYTVACASEDVEAYDYDGWKAVGFPPSPIG